MVNKMKAKVYDYIFQDKISIGEDYQSFSHDVLQINIKRERILSIILMILTSCAIGMRSITLNQGKLNDVTYIVFIVLFLLLFLTAALFLFATQGKREIQEYNYNWMKWLHISLNLIVQLLSSFGAVNATISNQQPFAYVISILSIASVVYLSPAERLLVYMLPMGVYTIGNYIVIPNLLAWHLSTIYTILLMIFALFISGINYTAYYKSYRQTKTIEGKNKELDALYKKTDEALRIRTEELSVAKEYESLRTAFFANLSHELRTPINVIFSAEQMLDYLTKGEKTSCKDENIIKYRKIIRQNCFRLIRMVSNLIDITKIDAGYFKIFMKDCDIVRIVEDITLSVATYIESRKIELVFDTEIEEKIIACDPDKIERIILNLLSNSVKYTPAGGQILVRVYQKTDYIAISVKDTGIGIPKEMKTIIFDRFVQVDRTSTRANEGSGIGLSIVKALVELHGGSVCLESVLEKGTEFIIEIPDRQINSEELGEEVASAKEQQYIEKIHIEFSDIYDLAP